MTNLERSGPISRELSGGQEHVYQLVLDKGEYARVVIEQHGIDVAITLLGTDETEIERIDEEASTAGEETVGLVAEAPGNYRLGIAPVSKAAPAGQYEVRVAETRPATAKDVALQQARILKCKFDRAWREARYGEAPAFAERALAISEAGLGEEHPFVATLLGALSTCYEAKQDLARAIQLRERALAICVKSLGEDHQRSIDMCRLLGLLYYRTNQVMKAQQLAERALGASLKNSGSEHRLSAACFLTLAEMTGDPKKAEQSFRRALEAGEKVLGPDHPFVANVLNSLGVFYMDLGNYDEAERCLVRSQDINQKTMSPYDLDIAVGYSNLGIIARQKKDYAAAEDHYRRAIAIIERAFGPANPRLAFTLNNLANVYRARGEYEKSLDAHLRVLKISETSRGPYHPLTLQSLGNIARTYAADGNIAEAIRYQARVEEVIERNIALRLAIGSEREKLFYLNSIAERTDRTISLSRGLAPDNPAASSLAALVLLQRKGRVLDAMSDSLASLRQRSTPEEQGLLNQFNDVAARLARLVLNGPQALSFEEHQKQVDELQDERNRLEAEIGRRSAEFRAVAVPVTLQGVQAAIPADATLVEFAVYRPFDPKAENNREAYEQPRYIAYVLHQSGEVRWRDLGDAKAIEDAIGSLRLSLADPHRRDTRARCRAVDEVIMRPLRDLIGDRNRLLISPDGALNLLPFEALVDERGRYLIERYSFAYLSSGRDLLRLKVPRTSGNSTSLVVAAPAFGEPETVEVSEPGRGARDKKTSSVTSAPDLSTVYFAPLAGTAQEAQAIKALFPEVTTLLGTQATESALKRVSAPRMLHIATHGFFLADGSLPGPNLQATRAISARATIENPLLRSGLALAGANLRAATGDDGILTALEASGLNLWGTKLVALSACDTGVGEVKNGEGVYGLRRAFVLAGAESLVMSLWPVSDYVTRETMTAYYRGLRLGKGRGESLRQVKLEMLKRRGREHPYYWASFIQSGEWASLDGKR